MGDIENKILLFLELGYKIDMILKELDIDEESLSDIIIELEGKELVTLEDKNWILTKKGKDILKNTKKELLKKLKIDYLHGKITRDEFQKKRKELEAITTIERRSIEDKVDDKKLVEDKKINCSRCGKDNKAGSKYCYKCGEPFKGV